MGVGTIVSSLLALLLSLALVLGLAWGAIALLRRWQDRTLAGAGGSGSAGGPATDRRLRFVRALPLGPRDRLVLVEVGEETMLLGVSAAGISKLSQWDATGAPLAPSPATQHSPIAGTPTW